jgi:hypothetical protein
MSYEKLKLQSTKQRYLFFEGNPLSYDPPRHTPHYHPTLSDPYNSLDYRTLCFYVFWIIGLSPSPSSCLPGRLRFRQIRWADAQT